MKNDNINKPIIYTIGHSNHDINYFLEMLNKYEINCIIDIRSVPSSRFNPQYNQTNINRFLNENGVEYLHLPKEFGAWKSTPELLDSDGILDFEKVIESKSFKNGLEIIKNCISKGLRISLMCSEHDPLSCHRFSLVSIGLENVGFNIMHILRDKSLMSNYDLKNTLLKKYKRKLSQPNLFDNNITIEDQLKEALRLKNKEIGYSPNSHK